MADETTKPEATAAKTQPRPPIKRTMTISANVALADINVVNRGLDALIKRIDHAHGPFDIHVAIAITPLGDKGAEVAHAPPPVPASKASEIVWTGITEDDDGFTY